MRRYDHSPAPGAALPKKLSTCAAAAAVLSGVPSRPGAGSQVIRPRQGKAGYAIGAAACASSMGGLIGLFTLILFIPLAKEIVLSFGPA